MTKNRNKNNNNNDNINSMNTNEQKTLSSRIKPATAYRTISPLTGENRLLEELYLANIYRPDFLEFRTDVLDLKYYEFVKSIARELGFGIVVSIKHPIFEKELITKNEDNSVDVSDFFSADYIDIDIANLDDLEQYLTLYVNEHTTHWHKKQNQQKTINPQNFPHFIISHHLFKQSDEFQTTFNTTLEKIEIINNKLNTSGIRFIPKLACSPVTEQGALNFMHYIHLISKQATFDDIIGIAMGTVGMTSRLVLPLISRSFAYAYLARPNASGQLPIGLYKKFNEFR